MKQASSPSLGGGEGEERRRGQGEEEIFRERSRIGTSKDFARRRKMELESSITHLESHEFTRLARKLWRDRCAYHPDALSFFRSQHRQKLGDMKVLRETLDRLSRADDSSVPKKDKDKEKAGGTGKGKQKKDLTEKQRSIAQKKWQALEESVAEIEETIRQLERSEKVRKEKKQQLKIQNGSTDDDDEGYNPSQLILRVYRQLKKENFPSHSQVALEFSLFFENYLWPFFPVDGYRKEEEDPPRQRREEGENDKDEDGDKDEKGKDSDAINNEEKTMKNGDKEKEKTSLFEKKISENMQAHLMLMVCMLLEKSRKNLPLWDAFLFHYPYLTTKSTTSSFSMKDDKEKRSGEQEEEEEMIKLPESFYHTKFASFFYSLLQLYIQSTQDAEVTSLLPPSSTTRTASQTSSSSLSLSLSHSSSSSCSSEERSLSSSLSLVEKTLVLRFLILCFQGFEESMLRRVTLSVCGASMWVYLPSVVRENLLHTSGASELLWRKVHKKLQLAAGETVDGDSHTGDMKKKGVGEEEEEDEEEKMKKIIQMTRARIDRDFFPFFLQDFFWVIEDLPSQYSRASSGEIDMEEDKKTSSSAAVTTETGPLSSSSSSPDLPMSVIYFSERVLEFLIDLIGQLPTRRCMLPILHNSQALVRARLASINQAQEAGVYRQMIELLDFYIRFEIDNDTGLPLTLSECVQEHYQRVASFQRFCFSLSSDDSSSSSSPSSLREAALSAVAAIDHPENLSKLLNEQDVLTLLQMATHLRLVDPHSLPGSPASSSSSSSSFSCLRLPPERSRKTRRWIRMYLTEVLISYLKKRPDQLEQLNSLSLYPSEEEMWNESIVPSEKYTGDTALPLPKLNLQFLTIHDYLLRNFNLF
ncbi:aquarius, partial [Cystoisospora suis]